ncbi:MAG: efflux RND transporter permease subunit [Gemmatimonadales bacterium]
MFISDFAIRRPTITIVAMAALVVFGIFALLRLKTDEFPEVNPPVVSVALIYPGASPDGVEKEVIDPIEEAVAAIAGVKKTISTSEDGFGRLIIEFQFGKALSEATQDVRDAISGVQGDLPQELEEPIIKKFSDMDRPVVSLALSSTRLSPGELTRIADPGLTRELRSLSGVAEVTVSGKQEREITVELRPQALQSANVSVGEVVQALALQNLATPVGRLTTTQGERSIRLRGRLEGPRDFEQIAVVERGGKIIRLGELAAVKDGVEEQRTLTIYNGKEAVGIDIKKASGYSTTDVSARILTRMEAAKASLPDGTSLDVIKNSGERVESSVWEVEKALVEGALLTVLVVFIFLNSWRSTVITGLALPVSVLASFIAVWAFGFTLNTMSLLGLSLAIGILIDDAIVVRENIVRHVEMGKDHFRAAHEGTDEIGLAVTATTFSILAVFIPVAFQGGLTEQWMKPFALTIACSVAVSLLVSFSLDPMLSAYWPDPHKAEHEKGWITRTLDGFNRWFNRQAERYKRVVAWALDHRLSMVIITTGTFFASFILPDKGLLALVGALAGIGVMAWAAGGKKPWFVTVGGLLAGAVIAVALVRIAPVYKKVGVGFFPIDDRSEFFAKIETPPGSSIEYTRRKVEQVEAIMQTIPEIRYTYTTIGGTSGAVDLADMYIRVVPKAERSKRSVDVIAGEVRGQVAQLTGLTTSVYTTDFGGGRKQLQINVQGDDVAMLNTIAEQIRAEVAQIPNVVDLGLSTKGQKPEVNVELNRGLAGSLGVTVGQVAQAIRPAFAGIDAGDWIDPSGETRDVRIRLAPEFRERVTDLAQLPLVVRGPTGVPSTIPLGQVAEIGSSMGPAAINHLNREPNVVVEWNVAGRSTGEVFADAEARLAAIGLTLGQPGPGGVTISQGGDQEFQNESFSSIFFSLGVAVLFMYLILVMQFGSFIDPIAIMVSLPLSLIGVMLGLSFANYTINIMSLIGVILLMGIVAKNAILLIDFAKWAREQRGLSIRDALIEAGGIRLRPIMMTTVALIAGMTPIALGTGEGSQFRSPLGVAVIGGVITSTFLTLLVIPTFYEILFDLREKVMGRHRVEPNRTFEPAATPPLAEESK